MDKFGYLVKNISLLTISSFSTKILSFLLVPVYTNYLSTYQYGSIDLVTTTVSLLIPLVTLNIFDSTLRFSLDKECDNKEVLSISLKYYALGLLVVLLLSFINYLLDVFSIIKEYCCYFIFMYSLTSLVSILSLYSRGINKVKISSIASALGSFTTIILCVFFLVALKWGIDGYFLSSICGFIVQVIYIAIALKIWNDFSFGLVNKRLEKEMVAFSKPMIINNLAWWINNASDRYIVTFFCGVMVNGVYSIGYKIPSIISVMQLLFHQAWVLSAVKDFDKNDKNGFFSKTYEFYNFFMIIICAMIITFNKTIASFLYASDFFEAWKYVPYLSIGFVFTASANYIGGIFQAVKNSKMIALSTFWGAVINILFDLLLTPFIGAMGAAMATTVSFIVVWLIRFITVKKYMNFNIHLKRSLFCYMMLFIQAAGNVYYDYCYENIIIIILLLVCFKEEFKIIEGKLCSLKSKYINM